MKYRIVADSCCDLTDKMKEELNCRLVPLSITVDNLTFVDRNLDTKILLEAIELSKNAPKTACPSPDEYVKAMGDDPEEAVFAVTLSSKLSGSYNSAALARSLLKEEHPDKKIYIFDSMSASAGETLVAHTIEKLAKLGSTFEEIVTKTEDFIRGMKTYFVIESLETLIKAGRVSRFKGAMAAMLSFRPIMSSDGAGSIKLYENIRGTFNALTRLAEIVAIQCVGKESLVIAHCNNPDRAQFLKEKIIKNGARLKDIFIVETAGLSTTYANNGGIVLAF